MEHCLDISRALTVLNPAKRYQMFTEHVRSFGPRVIATEIFAGYEMGQRKQGFMSETSLRNTKNGRPGLPIDQSLTSFEKVQYPSV